MSDYLDTGWWNPLTDYIVPPDLPSGPTRQPTQAASYETPWWVDTINRGIERAAQVATVAEAGYPAYPSYPSPSPSPTPMPGVAPQTLGGIQLSTTTLMLIVGGFLLFTLGKRGR